ATVTVPNMVNAQTWTTINSTVNLTAGKQTRRLSARSAGWNLNWWSIDPIQVTDVADVMTDPVADLLLFPNPVVDQLTVDCGDQLILQTTVFDRFGRVVAENSVKKQGSATINVSSLPSGVYFLSVQTEGQQAIVKKFVK
ncbi:MAG: T9SS type A sorting domain-containing protein, partial [Bacteroidales bacterium]|nr:T9SS type A sorting domain-containing protein [Bacteroidales bacterium]